MLSWLDPVAEATRRCLNWALPVQLFQSGVPWLSAVSIAVAALPLDAEAIAAVQKAKNQRKPLRIELSPALGFRREVVLPSSAAGDVDRVAALQLRATLPKAASGLVWRRLALQERDGRTTADYVILGEDLVKAVVKAINNLGAELHEVTVSGAREPLFPDAQQGEARKARRLALVLGITVVAALAQAAVLEFRRSLLVDELAEVQTQMESVQAALEARVPATSPEAGDPEALAAGIEAFRTTEFPLVQLEDLTRILPTEVWVSEFAMDRTGLRLSGFSSMDVGALLQQVRQLAWVARAEFVGPAVVDPSTGQTRFEMQITLKAQAT